MHYIKVTVMVRMVMKSVCVYLTPGALDLAVPFYPEWECECPGAEYFRVGKTYLFTGVSEYKPKLLSKFLKVHHKSLVMPWSETILDDMVKNSTAYPGLIFRPSLKLYEKYFKN